jgi:serine/threonine protein kinase
MAPPSSTETIPPAVSEGLCDSHSNEAKRTLFSADFLSPMPGKSRLCVTLRKFSLVTCSEESDPDDADYVLLNVIAEGGMGIVNAAVQNALGRRVALKRISASLQDKRAIRSKFLREAVVTGMLEHPNIVPVYELGETPEGDLFYVMREVTGTSWEKRIREISEEENLDILLRVCDAVAYAHSRGIIHRDIKPENVMLGEYGEILLMDWGLAAQVGPNLSDGLRDMPGIRSERPAGTPAYMAPEMAKCEHIRIGRASDLYLLGATLFQIATGAPPHEGDSFDECLRLAAENRIAETSRKGEIMKVAKVAMADRPEDRYPSVQRFQDAIRECRKHSASADLVIHAFDDFEKAERDGDYEDYSRTLYALRESLRLWPDNPLAGEAIPRVAMAYARCAATRGDYDLAKSLLNPNFPEHRSRISEINMEIEDRRRRETRTRSLNRLIPLFALLLFSVLFFSLIHIRQGRSDARAALAEAVAARQWATDEMARAKTEEEKVKILLRRVERERDRFAHNEGTAKKFVGPARNASGEHDGDRDPAPHESSPSEAHPEHVEGAENETPVRPNGSGFATAENSTTAEPEQATEKGTNQAVEKPVSVPYGDALVGRATFRKLVRGAVSGPDRFDAIPQILAGMSYSIPEKSGNPLEFHCVKSGEMFIAIPFIGRASDRIPQNEWIRDLEKGRWRIAGTVSGTTHHWQVFTRYCEEGESFSIPAFLNESPILIQP